MRRCACLLLGLLALAASKPLAAQARRVSNFAIVIGVNSPEKPKLKQLMYADDDACRVFEILENLGFDAVLLTAVDNDTRSQFPWLERARGAGRLRPPQRVDLDDTVTQTLSRARRALERGDEVHLLFYFSGHGWFNRDANEGEILLGKSGFGRSALHTQVLRAFAGTPYESSFYPHVVIDSCYAYSFVSSKGDQPLTMAAVQSSSMAEYALANHPNLGVLVATNPTGRTYEYDGFRGGVFSREFESAVSGAADLDHDGVVTYDEAAGFLLNANAGVTAKEATITVFVHPPGGSGAFPLVRWRDDRVLKLDLRGVTGRFWIADESTNRWVDANVEQSSAVVVRLSPGRQYRLFVPQPKNPNVVRRYEFTGAAGQNLTFANLVNGGEEPSKAGIDELLRSQLFSLPYGPSDLTKLRYSGALHPRPENVVEPNLETVEKNLLVERESGSVLKSGWFWAVAAGLVVAAGVTAAVVAGQNSKPSCPAGAECR